MFFYTYDDPESLFEPPLHSLMCRLHHTDFYRVVPPPLTDPITSVLHRFSGHVLSQHLRVQQLFLHRETEALQSCIYTPPSA